MASGKSYLIGFDASRAFVNEATGTENYSLNLLRALAKIDKKNRYRVYLRSQSGKSKWKVKNSLYTPDFDSRLLPNFEFKVIRPYRFWTQVGLALETWRNPVDLLFVPAHTLPILRRRALWVPSVPRVSKAKLQEDRAHGTRDTLGVRDTRYVVTIHDLGVEYLPGYHQFPQRYYLDLASRYAARHADALIAVSRSTKADLIKRYAIATKKIFVIPEGVDTSFFRPRSKKEIKISNLKFKIKEPYILFVGTVQPRKNLEMLIKAFSLLVGSRNKTTNYALQTTNLVIAGKLGWDYQEIQAAPNKFGVEDKVKFLGYVNWQDLPTLYSGAAVLAAPSLFEGFDLPILEALACGCTVIASDIPPHREIFGKISRNFKFQASEKLSMPIVLAKPKDVTGWSQILHQYISQYEKSKTFVTELRQSVKNFSWEQTAKSTLAVFGAVLR